MTAPFSFDGQEGAGRIISLKMLICQPDNYNGRNAHEKKLHSCLDFCLPDFEC